MSKKILSKRHLRRKIANNVKTTLAKLELDSFYPSDVLISNDNLHSFNNVLENINLNSTSNLNFPRDLEELPVIKDVETNDFVFLPQIENFDTPCFQEEVTPVGNNYELLFITRLRNWALSNNITHNCLNELVFLIGPKYPFLKMDARSILATPRKSNVILLENGEMIYFGIEKAIINKLSNGIATNENVINIEINVDGIPIYNNSSIQFWQILARSNDFRDNFPFVIAIFCGRGKPMPPEKYFYNFIEEWKKLMNYGVTYGNKVYTIKLSFFFL